MASIPPSCIINDDGMAVIIHDHLPHRLVTKTVEERSRSTSNPTARAGVSGRCPPGAWRRRTDRRPPSLR